MQSTLELTAVEFIQGWRGYGEGDVAGFKPYQAEQLVKQGFAKYHGKRGTPGRQKLNKEIKDEAINK